MSNHESVTIPVWLYERMAEVYYRQQYGLDVPVLNTGGAVVGAARKEEPDPPRVEVPREYRPGSTHLRDVEGLLDKVPSRGFEPRGFAAKKAASKIKPETPATEPGPELSPPRN